MYYRRIKEVRVRYTEAKNVVGDVVVSFNKQLQRHEEQLEKVSYRVEGLTGRSENIVAKVDELGKQTDGLASKLISVHDAQNLLATDLDVVKARLNDLKKAQEDVEKHIAETPEAKIEAAIPIKRERALEPLTDTELHVLEFIAEAGEKTAPEIRDLTKLTREHSARLVKKLYEEGYLERDTTKTPYKYRVKDEMLKILRKSEASI
jgi:chromosome segregation ATPase